MLWSRQFLRPRTAFQKRAAKLVLTKTLFLKHYPVLLDLFENTKENLKNIKNLLTVRTLKNPVEYAENTKKAPRKCPGIKRPRNKNTKEKKDRALPPSRNEFHSVWLSHKSQRGRGVQHKGALLLKSSQKFSEVFRGFQNRLSYSEGPKSAKTSAKFSEPFPFWVAPLCPHPNYHWGQNCYIPF